MGNLGFGELLLILFVVLLIFSSSKLPGLGDAIGRGLKRTPRVPPPPGP